MDELSKWIKNTPIEVKENNAAIVQKAVLKKDEVYSEKYLKEILEYIHEWELVVKTRVEAAQKQVKESKHSLDHYEKKMMSLTKTHEAQIAKGKTPDDKDVEKLQRNEEKLALAKNSFETQATRLCDLIETVVDNAWQDLVPFLIRLVRIQRDNLDSKQSLLEASNVVQNLTSLAEEYKINITTPPPGPAEKIGASVSAKKVLAPAPLKQQ